MSSPKKHVLVFVITFIISLTILGSIFLVVLILSKANNVNISQEDVPYISEYQPSDEESLGLLLLGCEQADSLPDVAVLFYYNAPQGRIYPIVVPTVTVAQVNGRVDTIQGHYDYAGTRGGVQAVQSAFGIELDRYAQLQKIGVSNVVDFFGGLSYNLPYDTMIGTEQFLKGEQLLDGRRVSAFIFNKVNYALCDYQLQSEIITKLLVQNLDANFIDNHPNFIDLIFNNCETNLNQHDFTSRKTSITNQLLLAQIEVSNLEIEGDYNTDFTEFYPSAKSIEDVRSIFSSQ